MNQRGFATLEVILMVMVIGILASIAVPRFGNITAEANTAKIQADLSTIDTAIDIYNMSNTTPPSKVSDLKEYLRDAGDIQPPTGKCYVNEKDDPQPIPSGGYQITTLTGESSLRATLGGKTAGYYTKKTTTGGTTDGE